MSSVSEAESEALAGREAMLLRQARSDDRAAYGQIVMGCQDRLYNAMLRLVGDADDVRELTQEAFTRGLSSLGSFRGDASAYTWLFRIGMNLAISRLRRVQRHRVFSLDAGWHEGNGHETDGAAARKEGPERPLEAMETRERGEQVLMALGRIDAEYRAMLVMRDVEGFDYRQMAQVLDLPLGTIKSRLFRARSALRDELKTYMDGK